MTRQERADGPRMVTVPQPWAASVAGGVALDVMLPFSTHYTGRLWVRASDKTVDEGASITTWGVSGLGWAASMIAESIANDESPSVRMSYFTRIQPPVIGAILCSAVLLSCCGSRHIRGYYDWRFLDVEKLDEPLRCTVRSDDELQLIPGGIARRLPPL